MQTQQPTISQQCAIVVSGAMLGPLPWLPFLALSKEFEAPFNRTGSWWLLCSMASAFASWSFRRQLSTTDRGDAMSVGVLLPGTTCFCNLATGLLGIPLFWLLGPSSGRVEGLAGIWIAPFAALVLFFWWLIPLSIPVALFIRRLALLVGGFNDAQKTSVALATNNSLSLDC